MRATQVISATDARNNFFDLLNTVYYNKQTVVVQKNKIPWVMVFPFRRFLEMFTPSQFFTPEDSLFNLIGLNKSKSKKGFSSDKYKLFPKL